MSLNISVGYDYDSDRYINLGSISWLRNPFGLPNVVEANVGEIHDPTLNDVCNRWNYAEAVNIDRSLFNKTVDWYAARFCALKQIYIYFDERGLKQFLPHYRGRRHGKIFPVRFKVEEIAVECNLGDATTVSYQNWMRELKAIAVILQDPKTEFHCTN